MKAVYLNLQLFILLVQSHFRDHANCLDHSTKEALVKSTLKIKFSKFFTTMFYDDYKLMNYR